MGLVCVNSSMKIFVTFWHIFLRYTRYKSLC